MPTYTGTPNADVINGSATHDVINGLAGNDTLNGLGGNDVIDAGTGTDTVDGGAGNDRLVIDSRDLTGTWTGGDGDDTLDASGSTAGVNLASPGNEPLTIFQSQLRITGIERVIGSAFNDSLNFSGLGYGIIAVAGAGNDQITSGGGDDVINGGDGNDSINIKFGDDTIYGGAGDDVIGHTGQMFAVENGDNHVVDGGTGIDTFRVFGADAGGSPSFVVDLQAGTATLNSVMTGGAFRLTTYALTNIENVNFSGFGQGADIRGDANANFLQANTAVTAPGSSIYLDGRGGNDILWANIRNDTLIGGDGDDQLFGLAGNDSLSGGAGDDLLHGGFYIPNASGRTGDADIIDGGDGDDTVSYADQSFVAGTVAASYAVTLNLATGTATSDGQTDTLISIENAIGSRANDVLIGNGGANRLSGMAGDDTLEGGGGNDTLDGGVGADSMNGGAGNDTYYVDNAGDTITDASGIDTVHTTIVFDWTAEGIENVLYTGSTAVTLTGGDEDNVFQGGSGDDVIDGRGGADRMTGGAGDDYYVIDDRGDRVFEEANGGLDVVRTRVTYSMQDNIENLVMFGTGNIGAIGNSLNNRIIGNEGNNVIKGGQGADRLEGGDGNDNYLANIEDQVIELANGGIDTIRTSDSWTLGTHFENLTLIGGSNTFGGGNAKANIITGNSGNNTIYGGGLGDQLRGGDGVDRFLYTAASDSTVANPDRIFDLRDNEIIDLRAIDANSTLAGDQAFTIVDAFTGQAGQMTVIYNPASGLTGARMDINGDGVADMAIIMNGDKEDFEGWWL